MTTEHQLTKSWNYSWAGGTV